MVLNQHTNLACHIHGNCSTNRVTNVFEEIPEKVMGLLEQSLTSPWLAEFDSHLLSILKSLAKSDGEKMSTAISLLQKYPETWSSIKVSDRGMTKEE